MQPDDPPFLLLVRFSYPARGGFRRQHDDDAGTEAFLYDPERLARRLALFEALTLPSLRAQTDRGFRTLFLVGERMPAAARARLEAAADSLPGAEVVAMPPLHAYEAVRRAFALLSTGDARQVLTLRLDDDDALACDFIARMRAKVRALMPLQQGEAPLIVAFNRGYLADLSGPRPAISAVVERLPMSCGTAMLAPAGSDDNVYRRNHRWLPQFFDTFSEAHSPAWLRTAHGDNDSDVTSMGRTLRLPPAELADGLAAAFPFLPPDWIAAAGRDG